MADSNDIETYAAYLRDLQEARGLKQYEFAKLVGRSPAWFSQILNGRRRLRPELVAEIADALQLPPRERTELLGLVHNEVGMAQHRQTPRQVADRAAKEDVLLTLGDWHVGAILELARCDDYVPDPSWVGAALRPRVSTHEAQTAMDGLRSLGYLDDDYRLVRSEVVVDGAADIGAGGPSKGATVHHKTLEMAREALDAVPANDRMYAAATIAMSEEDFANLRVRIQELVAPIVNGASREVPNRVYQLNVALFPASLYTDAARDPRTLVDDNRP